MIIQKLNHLNSDVIKDIRSVEAICKEFDGLNGDMFLDMSFNFDRDIKSLHLLYIDNKLISVLSMFIPTRNQAEIMAYTLPEYRNKGYFKQLFRKATDELKKHGIEDILIICEPQSTSGREVVKRLDLKYDFTEYFMRYTFLPNTCLEDCKYKSVLYTPGVEEIEILAGMSQCIFIESYDDAKDMIQNTFESKDRIQYVSTFEKKYVGIGSACFEGEQTSVYGLGILPEYQGRGLGRELLKLIINDLIKRGRSNITLEVNSSNKRAFKMYIDNGFKVETAYDYHRRKII